MLEKLKPIITEGIPKLNSLFPIDIEGLEYNDKTKKFKIKTCIYSKINRKLTSIKMVNFTIFIEYKTLFVYNYYVN